MAEASRFSAPGYSRAMWSPSARKHSLILF